MEQLPEISQELQALGLLRNKLDQLKALEVDYASKAVKQYYRDLRKVETFIEDIVEIKSLHDNCLILLEMKSDKDLWEMAIQEYNERCCDLQEKLIALYSKVAAGDEESSNEIIIEIRAGTGGDEASLFASEILKMYTKFAENKGWTYEIIDLSQNELKGIKNGSITIQGTNIWKFFQFEIGVHRVQRVPETEANGRIHTSTVTVAVLPCPEEESDLEIDTNDLRVDTYRSGGAGGQHVNRTDSAVRLTHLPTGLVVQCQDERSQIKNKAKAMKILKIKLVELEKNKIQQERNTIRDQHIGTGERSEKSRTYNFSENRISDHVFGVKIYQLDIVLQGNLHLLVDKMYEEYQKEKLKDNAKISLIENLMK